MRNQFRKTNNVNCANSIFFKNLSLKRKSTNEVSGFKASTQYERRWDMSVKPQNRQSKFNLFKNRKTI